MQTFIGKYLVRFGKVQDDFACNDFNHLQNTLLQYRPEDAIPSWLVDTIRALIDESKKAVVNDFKFPDGKILRFVQNVSYLNVNT
jgi:hypothetical protein